MLKNKECKTSFYDENNIVSFITTIEKMLFDYIIALFLLILLSPILTLIAWKIKKDNIGSVIFEGLRIGKDGHLFKCYKFRSMYDNDDAVLEQYFVEHEDKRIEWKKYHKLKYDPRVTAFGDFIRKTSLDELPQLINVVRGEMSIVGPRPYLPIEKEEMGEAYDTIIKIKPGITGYWQVNGRNEVDFQTRLEMDCWYISNWSIWQDMSLLLKTVWVVITRKGAR